MRYKSTRGGINGLSFRDTVLTGLAPDGGLLVPEQVPHPDIRDWKDLPYRDLAYRIYSLFIDDISPDDLRELIGRSYSQFSCDDVVRLKPLKRCMLLELFHGPTLSFKDIALQFLGNLFEYILEKDKGRLNVLGATSGDTGSAAIYGLRSKKNINVFILHPYQKISPVQELQMTTVEDANVFNLAVRGTFDDCQKIVKDIFADIKFKQEYALGAVNSINWARILAQIVYYFYAYFRMGSETIDVAVPTGNFGDIFAGFMARRMGLPVRRLILATNENDILYRFVNSGDYSIRPVVSTISPAMDIQIASNFERYLFYFFGEDPGRTKKTLSSFLEKKALHFGREDVARVQEDFRSVSVTDAAAKEVIKNVYEQDGYFVCPHTACGIGAAGKAADGLPVLCLATAHPAKFPEAVSESTGDVPPVPSSLQGLGKKEKRLEVMDNNRLRIREYVAGHAVPETR